MARRSKYPSGFAATRRNWRLMGSLDRVGALPPRSIPNACPSVVPRTGGAPVVGRVAQPHPGHHCRPECGAAGAAEQVRYRDHRTPVIRP